LLICIEITFFSKIEIAANGYHQFVFKVFGAVEHSHYFFLVEIIGKVKTPTGAHDIFFGQGLIMNPFKEKFKRIDQVVLM
jgi:hypothetical protein